jgi:hypothetical protein
MSFTACSNNLPQECIRPVRKEREKCDHEGEDNVIAAQSTSNQLWVTDLDISCYDRDEKE